MLKLMLAQKLSALEEQEDADADFAEEPSELMEGTGAVAAQASAGRITAWPRRPTRGGMSGLGGRPRSRAFARSQYPLRPRSSRGGASPQELPSAATSQAAAAGAGLSRNQLRAAAPLVPVGTQATPMQPGAFDLDAVEARGRHLGYMSNEGPVKVLESPVWALRRNATWMQPPRMCPGKPSAVGLDVGAPPEAVRAEMMRMIDLMVEGQCVVESGEHRALVEDRCVFLTRDCAALNLTYGGHSAAKAMAVSHEEWERLRTSALLDLKPRSLGSCALVGNSRNLLKGARGADIDAHDTIFRYNAPLKSFEKAVGRRPTSVMWLKANYAEKDSRVAELMFDLLVGADRVPKTLQHRGKPLMILNKGTPASKCAKERARWYRMAGGTRRRHPTGGFARPFQLLASGLCTRVDMYGFSFQPDSSGKYFDKKKAVVSTHLTHFEHWAYRYLMQQGKLCVYGE